MCVLFVLVLSLMWLCLVWTCLVFLFLFAQHPLRAKMGDDVITLTSLVAEDEPVPDFSKNGRQADDTPGTVVYHRPSKRLYARCVRPSYVVFSMCVPRVWVRVAVCECCASPVAVPITIGSSARVLVRPMLTCCLFSHLCRCFPAITRTHCMCTC